MSVRSGRIAIGARAVLAAVLAVGAAVLFVDVADWRYARVDLTRAGRNTLDPAVLDVVDKLPEPVAVDVFLRPLEAPYRVVYDQASGRVLEWLAALQQARRGKIDVRLHDLSEVEAVKERQRELGTEGANKLVFSCGERRDELELFGELCTVAWGNPSEELARYLIGQGIPDVVDRSWRRGTPFRPAQLVAFHGEELVTQALLKVSSARAPRVAFLAGHGEPSLEGSEPTDLSRLRAALERDGFEPFEWDPLESPEVPADCEMLALIGAKQAYQPRTRDAIVAWVEAGGRLLAAPDVGELHEERQGGIVDLLRGFGIATRPGIVCQPFVDYAGQKVDGAEECARIQVDEGGMAASHPLTEPMRARGRRVQFTLSPSLDGGGYESESGRLLPLVTSPRDCWRDLVPYDFRFDKAKGEERERCVLVMAKEMRPESAADGSVREGRLLAVASAFFFDNESIDFNRDFVLNAFNWLSAREYQIKVRPLARGESYLDFQRGSARPILGYSLWLGLPALCAAVGVAIFLARRRS